jgi:hypothetical protein
MRRDIQTGWAAALVTVVLASSPAPALASPVYVDTDTHLVTANSVASSGVTCSHFVVPLPPTDKPVVENGGPVTVFTSVTGSSTGPTAGDTASVTASATAVASVSSADGLPRSMDFTISGQASLTTQQPLSACLVQGDAEATLDVHLVLTAPGYLTLETVNDAHSYASVELDNPVAGVTASTSSFGWRTEHHLRLRVPAGTYQGKLDGSVGTAGSTSGSGNGSAEVHVTFTPFGALTDAATGPGARYVTLPAAASCGTGTLDARITSKRKLVAKLSQLRFFLGNHLVAKVRHPRRGVVVHVPLDPAAPSQLRAEATLQPSGHHKRVKKLDVTAGYEACS